MNIYTFYGVSPVNYLNQKGISYEYGMFWSWLEKYKPDMVTRKVMMGLMYKYEEGDKESLFGKMKQLISTENYELCAIFHDMFTYTGLQDDFKRWEKSISL